MNFDLVLCSSAIVLNVGSIDFSFIFLFLFILTGLIENVVASWLGL